MKLIEKIKDKLATRHDDCDMDVAESRSYSGLCSLEPTEAMVYLEFMRLAKDVLIEEEKTKRYEMWSQMEVKKAEMRTELAKMYIGKVFEERKQALDMYYNVLKDGIDSGNLKLVTDAMTMIGGIVTTSPLKDIDKIVNSYLTGGQIEPIEL